MIKAVLFDFYGLFLPDAYSAWLDNNNLKREGIYKQLIDQLDRNEVTTTDFLNGLSKELGRPVLSDEIHQQPASIDNQLVALAKDLSNTYKIGLFSNASLNLRSKLTSLGIVDIFDEIIISSEIGFTKPSKESFEAAASIMGLEAERIMLIDDNQHNVLAAIENGLVGVQYTNLDNLKNKLNHHLGRQATSD